MHCIHYSSSTKPDYWIFLILLTSENAEFEKDFHELTQCKNSLIFCQVCEKEYKLSESNPLNTDSFDHSCIG